MSAAVHDISVEAKASLRFTAGLSVEGGGALNLTGCSVVASIKSSANDATVPIPFVCSIPNPTDGKIVFELTDTATAKMNTWTTAVWDARLVYEDGFSKRLLQGKVTISAGVA